MADAAAARKKRTFKKVSAELAPLPGKGSGHSGKPCLCLTRATPARPPAPLQFQYRGMDLETMLNLSHEEFSKHVTARMRRRMNRGLARQCNTLMTRLKKAKKGERPSPRASAGRSLRMSHGRAQANTRTVTSHVCGWVAL